MHLGRTDHRLRALRTLAARMADSKWADGALSQTAKALFDFPLDLPYVLLYRVDATGTDYAAGYGSRVAAEDAAISRCRGGGMRPAVWVRNGWAALAVGDGGARGWGWSTRSLADAKDRAVRNAGPNASIRCWVYSGR